jgi:uncharacterized membrane protein YkvA (DUF1232 family)
MDGRVIVGIAIGLVGLWLALLALFWLLRPRGVATRELLAVVPDVLRLIRSLITDSDVPLDVRLVLIGLAAWILSPIDLIPEFIPVLGPIDDVVVAVVAMRYARRRVGIAAMQARWTGSATGFEILRRVVGGERVPSADDADQGGAGRDRERKDARVDGEG